MHPAPPAIQANRVWTEATLIDTRCEQREIVYSYTTSSSARGSLAPAKVHSS